MSNLLSLPPLFPRGKIYLCNGDGLKFLVQKKVFCLLGAENEKGRPPTIVRSRKVNYIFRQNLIFFQMLNTILFQCARSLTIVDRTGVCLIRGVEICTISSSLPFRAIGRLISTSLNVFKRTRLPPLFETGGCTCDRSATPRSLFIRIVKKSCISIMDQSGIRYIMMVKTVPGSNHEKYRHRYFQRP